MLSKNEIQKLYINAIDLQIKEEPKSMAFGFKYVERIIEESNLNRDFIRESILYHLSKPIEENDAGFIEAILFLMGFFGEPADWINTLHNLVIDKNHRRHEDIVHDLQYYRNPESVHYLDKVISIKEELSYLDYDDYGGFYRQCLFALMDIGTKDAIKTILGYINSNNKILREEAISFAEEFDIRL